MLNKFPQNTQQQVIDEITELMPDILELLKGGSTVQIRLSRRGHIKASYYTFKRLQVRSEAEEGGAVNG